MSVQPEPDAILDDRCYDLENSKDINMLFPSAGGKYSLPEGTSEYKMRLCDRTWCNSMNSSQPHLCKVLVYDDGSKSPGLLKVAPTSEEEEENSERSLSNSSSNCSILLIAVGLLIMKV